jgi:hypothetical protein
MVVYANMDVMMKHGVARGWYARVSVTRVVANPGGAPTSAGGG